MGQSGKSGMGMSKHRGSGYKNGAGKSPKLRQHLKREAEKNDRKAGKPLPHSTVTAALNSKGGPQ